MRLEGKGVPRDWRRLTPVAVLTLVLLGVTLPAWLWYTRGRKLQLNVVIQASAYVAGAGETVELSALVEPAELAVRWEGPGVQASGAGRARWTAPAAPGVYAARAIVHRSGTTVEDSISLQVLARPLAKHAIRRPPAARAPPTALPACGGRSRARVELTGRACRGATLVARVVDAPADAAELWHWWDGDLIAPARGALANLPLAADASGAFTLHTLIVAGDRSCTWTIERRVPLEDCDAGPGAARVFADFTWQRVGPGHFRFAAKPSRSAKPFERYAWDFGDGTRRTTRVPSTARRYAEPARFRLVRLQVSAGAQQAEAVRVIADSVPAR